MAVPAELQEEVLKEATSATPNYDVDYNDKRFTDVTSEKNQALTESEHTYDSMIDSSDKFYDAQIQATKDWEAKQSQIQQDNTDFAIEQIEQQKDQAHKDYIKEQSGAYVDWQKQSNAYGVEAEKMASAGLDRTGYSESAQVSMYNTYQNRVATARESYNQAVLNYNNAIKDAQLQNNAALAEIAYQSLQQCLTLSLEGFQYKNQLILDKANKQLEIENIYYRRYQDVLNQINTENAMKEEVRQFESNQKFTAEQNELDRQHSEKLQTLQQEFTAKENELDRQHDEAMADLEQKYKIEYLNASTEKEKELLKIQHQNDIAKLNQQLANEKALLKYEYDLKNSGNSISSAAIKSGAKAIKNAISGTKITNSNTTNSFTGTTYNDAINYMTKNGVPSSVASGIYTASEFSQRRSSYSMTGQGSAAVKLCSSYPEYLSYVCRYNVEQYKK